ncbi:hypothetical protein CAPTEDRAFT_228040 [Capitella teleta]|uniref:C2H2-type domain-containing protein n=1 Tax=Capitella teleta TaxID=283909 RepID=R7TH26_CAPTE|nr:hypothetical protein CAPTEDRAFT_228040 [Capitella teleta]|eukprot:ELT92767.1 hypothetical protein CAPTEDRAFT_228040 [Capitella teleta]
MMQQAERSPIEGFAAQVFFSPASISPQWLCCLCKETQLFSENSFRSHFDELHAKTSFSAQITVNVSVIDDCNINQNHSNSFDFEWHPSNSVESVSADLEAGAIEQSLQILSDTNELERNLEDFLLQDDVVMDDLSIAPKREPSKKQRWFKRNTCCTCGKKGFHSHASFHVHMRMHPTVSCEYCMEDSGNCAEDSEQTDLAAEEVSDLNDLSQITELTTVSPAELLSDEPPVIEDKKKRIECQECGVQNLANHRAYHVHLRGHAHRKGADIKCVYCEKVLSAEGAWAKTAKEDSLQCEFCGEMAASHKEHHKHISTHINHTKHPINCGYCGKRIRKNCVKEGEKPLYECVHCEWKANGLHYNFHRHQIKHLPWEDSTFTCQYCKKSFTKAQLQEYFKKKYTDKSQFKCAQCAYITHVHAHHHQHLLNHKQFDASSSTVCSFCDQDVTSTVVSDQPVSSSSFECSQCPFGPGQEDELKRHLQLEHGVDQGIYEFACDDCDYRTHDMASAKRHQFTHEKKEMSQKNEYQCGECNFSCTRESILKCHMEIHNGQKPLVKCSVCGYVNESQKGLLCHMRQTHNLAPKVCAECGAIFTKIEDLESHLGSEHGITDSALLCTHCGKLSRDEEKHLRHVASHAKSTDSEQKKSKEEKKVLKCEHCDFSTEGALTLRRHVLCHADSFFQCHLCAEMCDTAQSLDAHKETAHPLNDQCTECPACNKTFKSFAQLQWHNSKQHKSKATYKCSECNFTSQRIGNMKRHKEKHSKSDHQCTLCDYKSTSERYMASHYRKSHLVEPPVQFASTSGTKVEKKKGLPRQSNKVVCDLCGLLINKATIKNHKKRHLGVRPLKCQYTNCQYSCVTSSELSSHIKRRHLGVKIPSRKSRHVCYVCGYSTCEKYRLMQHLQKTHRMNSLQQDDLASDNQLSLLLDQNNFDALQIEMPNQILSGEPPHTLSDVKVMNEEVDWADAAASVVNNDTSFEYL